MKSLAKDYPQIDVCVYEAGVDVDYIPMQMDSGFWEMSALEFLPATG